MTALKPWAGTRFIGWRGIRHAVSQPAHCRNNSTTTKVAEEDFNELEPQSTTTTLPEAEIIKSFDPIATSRRRKRQLPASRYGSVLTQDDETAI